MGRGSCFWAGEKIALNNFPESINQYDSPWEKKIPNNSFFKKRFREKKSGENELRETRKKLRENGPKSHPFKSLPKMEGILNFPQVSEVTCHTSLFRDDIPFQSLGII